MYCDTSKSEHPDNVRFRADVERWIGKPVLAIKSEKYSTVEEVFADTRYMSGPKGARCTTELKKLPRFAFQQADDIHIFGFTADETRRIDAFKMRNPELNLEWPLQEYGIFKDDCYRMIEAAGIKLPVMYSLGYKNNNCLGCVKATSPAYWQRVRATFPETFERRCTQSRDLGVRLVRVKGERIFLDQLPKEERLEPVTEDISCGPECGQVG